VPATIVGLGLLGTLFASTFVLYRHANALSNMLEWPVLLLTGLLVPLSLLPAWVHPIGWSLAPTWGMRAMRDAAFGGSAWAEIALTLLLGLAYLGIAALFLRYFERKARAAATLALT
jgi:ABC-2 type transport system permease protein